MKITRFEPFDVPRFDNLMRRLYSDLSNGAESANNMWAPPVDIKETEDAFTISVELPGMNMEDIDIELTQDSLAIRGERKFEDKKENENFVRVERFYGGFSRTFTLGVPIEPDGVKATYKDGVLTVLIPKSAAVRPKKVSIQIGE